MTPEARNVLRNAGLLVMGFSVLMMLLSFGSMLWMDVPLILVGAGMVGYAFLDGWRSRNVA